MIEILGIISTLFIVLAFVCKNVVSIRLLDIIGAIGFVVYGTLTKTWSTLALNIALILINLFYLIKYYKEKHKNAENQN